MKLLNKKTAYLYLILLGFFGAHRFYFGKNGTGALMLINGLISFFSLIIFISIMGSELLTFGGIPGSGVGSSVIGGLNGAGVSPSFMHGLVGHMNLLAIDTIMDITSLIGTGWVIYDFFHLSKWLQDNNSSSGSSMVFTTY